MTEKDFRWNRFIEEICYRDTDSLSAVQKNAVLCFWYDTEMQSGGHSGYFDNFPDIVSRELIGAIMAVGCKAIADNYQKALKDGEKDGWVQTDDTYYAFSPSLLHCLMEYVESNRDVIFN